MSHNVRSIKTTPYEVVFGRKPNLQGSSIPQFFEEEPVNFSVSQNVTDTETLSADLSISIFLYFYYNTLLLFMFLCFF